MALRNRNIMHISSINECLKEIIIKKNITLKTSKEEIFIKLLQPICEKYNLPLDTFKIANLEKITTFSIDGKVLYKESLKNKKGNIKTYGLTDHINIYLDRTALELSKFNIHEGNVGLNEIKALMNTINTIAHELSHYLYNTTDNTVEHYNKEIKLQEEIIKLYI
jgi:6-pyruvoyl-tetrahydropterin synthase